MCGVSILPNPANMCVNCIKGQVDITDGIQKQVNILWCKGCGRYLQPPKHWMQAELESKELLTYCIKRIRGLNKVRGAWACVLGGLRDGPLTFSALHRACDDDGHRMQ